ncbi:hypothetical protein [Amycolatopsis jiangsuensis]|uniref:Uncharacterized protein n=1 Tax=Amycolatopsis jiangsuensis TaxID=1181879 RepID=A0A840J844_9PSEU|nr:hypothetical protein [Amycolatopsis jiangsuensis]MBB4689644.1 hypothetical protein [Amycolatopsis jiangsuensis]
MLEAGAAVLRRLSESKVPCVEPDRQARALLSEPGALTAALNRYRVSRRNLRIGETTVPTLYVWSTDDVFFGSTATLGTENQVIGPYWFEQPTA